MGKLLEYLKRSYGCNLQTRDSVVSASTSVAVAAQNSPDRFALTFWNLSAETMYLARDSAPSSTHGIKLAAGGYITMVADEEGEAVGNVWYVVATGAANLDVSEVLAA